MKLVVISNMGGHWWFSFRVIGPGIPLSGNIIADHPNVRVVTVEAAREDYGIKVPPC